VIEDILVHIPTERSPQPVIDASISLTGTLRAHLDAMAAGYIRPGVVYATDGAVATDMAAIFEMEQTQATERSTAALAAFETEARKARIPYECRPIQDLPAEAASAVASAARLYDLAIVMQPDGAESTFDNSTATEILFQAGGPVLVIPHIFKGAFKPRRIGVCWDGSRCAARALRDAKPLLSRAETVVVISINEAQVAPAEASASKLMKHLGRSEIATTLIELTAERSEIQPSILSLAADESLDMVVMGAYGHSRIREGLFGGVTREMLKTMTVPALMSH
jgi:nucleotide-binding universal stress UspA family protein